VVKFFDLKKGWGMISTQETPPRDIFVHQSQIKMDGFRYLEAGEEVEFEVKKNDRGLHAEGVVSKGGKPLDKKDL